MTDDARKPIPPAKRRRLQQCYEHASRSSSQGNFDYATELFGQCVVGDPSNPIYTKAYLDNLFKKYNNNKKGSNFAGFKNAGAKTTVKKASMSKDWLGVITAGLKVLELNPWDVSTLQHMGVACEELKFDDCQLTYLRTALDANPKDIEVNRLCGRALARVGRFDDAISCWRRVELAKPGDEESQRAIADLAVEKTIHHGGYEEAEDTKDVRAKAAARDEDSKLTPEQVLEKAISKEPANIANYVELAELHARNDRFADAEGVLVRAVDASGGDIAIRERLEDTQLRRYRADLEVAKQQAAKLGTPEAADLERRKKSEVNRIELEIYRSRADRNPQNTKLKFEVGLRLKRIGKYDEAIKWFQAARGDNKLKGDVYLELGECFQSVKQYRLALESYKDAIEGINERDVERRLLALYRAGALALIKMNDSDTAEKYLTEVARLDFGYKDVAKLLGKIAEDRNNGES